MRLVLIRATPAAICYDAVSGTRRETGHAAGAGRRNPRSPGRCSAHPDHAARRISRRCPASSIAAARLPCAGRFPDRHRPHAPCAAASRRPPARDPLGPDPFASRIADASGWRTPGAIEHPPLLPLPRGHMLHGRYEILKPLARGGFSFVYLGRHERTGMLVAIKEACPINGLRRADGSIEADPVSSPATARC